MTQPCCHQRAVDLFVRETSERLNELLSEVEPSLIPHMLSLIEQVSSAIVVVTPEPLPPPSEEGLLFLSVLAEDRGSHRQIRHGPPVCASVDPGNRLYNLHPRVSGPRVLDPDRTARGHQTLLAPSLNDMRTKCELNRV